MADTLHTTETRDVQSTGNTSSNDHTEASTCRSGMLACCMGTKGLKGLGLMAACCGAPLLLVLALPVVGSALGGLGTSAVSTLALLACPVGMVLMMWMMMRGQKAGTLQPVQPLTSLSQAARVTSTESHVAAVLPDIPDVGETSVTLLSPAQEKVVTPPRSANGHVLARPTLAVNDQPPPEAPTPPHDRSHVRTEGCQAWE